MSVTDMKEPLVTLRDAGDYIQSAFANVTRDEALVATVEALIAAAESGQAKTVSRATDQLESYLYAQRRIRSIERAKSGPVRIAATLRRRLSQDD